MGQSLPRNPGPSWGYGFIRWADRWWPAWFFRLAAMIGTWVALAFMPGARRHSRAFLSTVLGRPPTRVEVWRHFFTFAEFLVLKLRVARGVAHVCTLDPGNDADFTALVRSGRPALFGTFHFGDSDLLGYFLSGYGRRVSIIRLRVGNSDDTRLLGRLFGDGVSFIWSNEPGELLFGIKQAIDSGNSLAMKCDRLERSARTEPFHFLGRSRLFPFTIYHLALLFERPVIFCVGIPVSGCESRVRAFPVFMPDPAAGRDDNLRRARHHFQIVLDQLEELVRENPSRWFNFIPLNPEPGSPL